MGKRCAREAADAAERYLRTNPVSYLSEQDEQVCTTASARRGPPVRLLRTPAGR